MHNLSPTSPVLGDPLQLLPAQPHLRDVCLKFTPPGVFRSPPLSLALRVPRQGMSCNVAVWLSQGVAKPSPSSLKSISMWTWLVVFQRSLLLTLSIHCIPKIFCRHWFTKVWILFNEFLFIRQVAAPYSNTNFTIVLNRCIFVVSPITLDFYAFLKNAKRCPCFADSCVYVSLCASSLMLSTILPRYLKRFNLFQRLLKQKCFCIRIIGLQTHARHNMPDFGQKGFFILNKN